MHTPPPKRPAEKIRKQYVNQEYPEVLLRFEDGHEIRIPRGHGKSFDAYPGEMVKVLAIYDYTSSERVLVCSMRSDELPDGKP